MTGTAALIASAGLPSAAYFSAHNIKQTAVRGYVIEHTVAAVEEILEQVLQFDELVFAVE